MRIASSGMPSPIITPTKLSRHPAQRGRQRLLDGEVEDRLLPRGQLDGALLQAADRLGDRERARLGVAGGVAVHADAGDEADALLVAAAHLGAEHARRHQADVARRIEAVEGERVAAGHDHERVGLRRERHGRDGVVGHEDADDVRLGRRLDVLRGEAVGLGRRAGVVVADAGRDVEARVAQVQRPRAPLVAVPDDGDPLAVQRRQVRVTVVVDRRHRLAFLPMDGGPRVAIVTGGSSGIGLAVGRMLVERGYDVVLTARTADKLEAAADGRSARAGRPATAPTRRRSPRWSRRRAGSTCSCTPPG